MAKKLGRKSTGTKNKAAALRTVSKARTAKPAKNAKYVYLFGRKTDGNGSMKPLLGGKGANLAEMCRIGLPVPPGFTITTEVCTYYYDHKRTYPPALKSQMQAGVSLIERQTGKTFGTPIDIRNCSVQRNKHEGIVGIFEDRTVVFFTRRSIFRRPPSSDEFCMQAGVNLLRGGGLSRSPKT